MWTRFDKLVQRSRDTNLWIIYSIAEERLSLVQNKSLEFCVFFLIEVVYYCTSAPAQCVLHE